MSARYEVVIYQSNNMSNRVPVTVVADDAAEAKRKALALAGHMPLPLVRIIRITATEADK